MIGRYRGRGHQLAEVRMCRTNSSTSATYLTAQLREAVPYLADAGWHQTAKLLTDAATEIEHLQVNSRGQRDRGAWRIPAARQAYFLSHPRTDLRTQ